MCAAPSPRRCSCSGLFWGPQLTPFQRRRSEGGLTSCCRWGVGTSLLSRRGPLPLRLNHSADGHPLKQGKDPAEGRGAAEPGAHGGAGGAGGGGIKQWRVLTRKGLPESTRMGSKPHRGIKSGKKQKTVKIPFKSQGKSFCLLLREREFSRKKAEATAHGRSCPQCWEDPAGH